MIISPAAEFLRRRKAPHIGEILEVFRRVFGVDDADTLYNTLIMAASQVLELDPDCQRVAAYLKQMEDPSFKGLCTSLCRSSSWPPSNTIAEMIAPTFQVSNEDGLFLKGRAVSVGYIIKSAAKELETLWMKDDLPYIDRRKCVLGGSSILDMTDRTPGSMLDSLFSQDECKELQWRLSYLKGFIPSSTPLLSAHVFQQWNKCVDIAKGTGIQEARMYLLLQMEESVGEMANGLSVLLSVLDGMTMIPELFSSEGANERAEITAHDIYAILWHPILTELFKASPAKVRVSVDPPLEPDEDFETREERAFASCVKAQLVVDHQQDEYALAVIEVARDTWQGGVCLQRGKLLREVKSVSSTLNNLTLSNCTMPRYTAALGVRITGISGDVLSMHVPAPGLYVSLLEASIQLPDTLDSMEQFGDTLRALFWFRDQVDHKAGLLSRQLSFSAGVLHT
ncbi:hypothetical protein EDD21DRAFT_446383 [Dissophora ornata]|nr:hypothetical protein BGZ58_008862 [Dissophora ornata]KAI8598216.1 hypothetical protein EDD21DRAFT_446383 [Dissophora ornata]